MASHWYIFRDGVARRYTQRNKDGSESKIIRRGQALADGAAEGLTSILARVSDQGGIIEWAGRIGIAAGLEACACALATGIPADQIADLARDIYKRERERAANRGSEIHDAIERFLSRGEVSADPIEAAAQRAVYEWQASNGLTHGHPEHCLYFKGVIAPFSTQVTFGGTTDWISPGVIADYKTVEADKRGKFWTGKATHCAQLAGYRLAGAQMGLCDPKARCVNLYVNRLDGALVGVTEWTAAQLNAGAELVALACRAGTLTERIEG